MTDSNYTHITILLDRSGSMAGLVKDVEGGFDTFIEEQRKVAGRATLTVAQFDDVYEVVHDMTTLDVPSLKGRFQPRGSTALLDAFSRAITDTGRVLEAMPEEKRPGKVIVVVMTDGCENASRECSPVQLRDMVTHQRERYGWDFVFIGANIDAFAVAQQYGVPAAFVAQVSGDAKGVADAYAGVSRGMARYRVASVEKISELQASNQPSAFFDGDQPSDDVIKLDVDSASKPPTP